MLIYIIQINVQCYATDARASFLLGGVPPAKANDGSVSGSALRFTPETDLGDGDSAFSFLTRGDEARPCELSGGVMDRPFNNRDAKVLTELAASAWQVA